MAISCAYCGGSHDAPADVRRCWSEHDGVEAAAAAPSDGAMPDRSAPRLPLATTDEAPPPPPPPPPPGFDDEPPLPPADERSAARQTRRPGRESPSRRPVAVPDIVDDPPTGLAVATAGPDRLGRHAVVEPAAEVPDPWRHAERLRVDADAVARPIEILTTLRSAAASRTRLVIELDGVLARRPMLATDAPPHRVGARFEFHGDELFHLVWSNALDLRGATPTWSLLDQAVHRGLAAVDPASGHEGDVVLRDGRTAWLDGGPVGYIEPIDGVPVLGAAAVEHGQLVAPIDNRTEAELAPDQLAAVTHDGGAARIIAPAGSGKTRVLTERARHLLTRWNLPPSALTLVAFNKRAQIEMSERTTDLPGLQVRTLNALALAIVNGSAPFAPQPRRFATIDEPEVRRILGDLVRFPRRRNADPVAPWIEALSLVRLGLVAPDEVEERYGGEVDGFADVWPHYVERLDRRGAVDFDDQIHRALGVLLSDPVARRAAQRVCRVMLVDEFQDLTPAHLLLIRLLAAPGGAVFGVGDDDQTIYGYNGADPAWLIEFGELFPSAGAHPLEVNYRCPGDVVDAADRLLRRNRRRVPKAIRAASMARNGLRIDTAVDPVNATVTAVRSAIDGGARPRDVAVLSRVNATLAPVQVALVDAGVPVSGGVGTEFVERTSVRAVLSWLRLACATERRLASDDLREALRRPSRSFHPRVGDWIAEQTDVVGLFRLAGRLRNESDATRLEEFAADIQKLQKAVADGAPTSDLLFLLVDEIGLAGSVATLDATRRGMHRGAQGDDLTAMSQLAALHDDVETFESWLLGRLSSGGRRRDDGAGRDGVALATVHRVKGQEWPHVVAHFADAEQYPHRLADDVEEERRLFHVAITRTSGSITVTTGPQPSPFVAELTTEPAADDRPEVLAHTPEPARRTGGGRRGASSSDPTADLDTEATERFERLRGLRTQLAEGKPAYVVFDNKTLAAIARTAPTTRAELSRISGVGPAKLEKYGDAVVELIAELL